MDQKTENRNHMASRVPDQRQIKKRECYLNRNNTTRQITSSGQTPQRTATTLQNVARREGTNDMLQHPNGVDFDFSWSFQEKNSYRDCYFSEIAALAEEIEGDRHFVGGGGGRREKGAYARRTRLRGG